MSPQAKNRRPPQKHVVAKPLGRARASTEVGGSQAWIGFLKAVDRARGDLGYPADWSGATECYFRGQRDQSFDLAPSLFRTVVPAREDREDYWWQLETDFFYEFRARARELHNHSLTSWDVVFAMQHYGVPTRLLDWSEVFAVAVFFALDGYQPGEGEVPVNPCVWVLNPYRLNKWAWGTHDLIAPRNLGWDKRLGEYWEYDELLLEGSLDWKRPVAVYPEKTNSRLHIQRASFTMHGDSPKPLNKQVKDPSILQSIPLPAEAIPDALRFLRQAGISRSQIYPELDGLAQDLRHKYGLVKGII